jgi:GAF domain-containing protein
VRRVKEIEPEHFVQLFTQVTEETRELVEMIELAQSETFDSMLAQVLESFALKIGEMAGAERTRVYFVDADRKELFHLSASEETPPLEMRVPVSHGIAGRVARLGRRFNVSDVKSDPDFEPGVDLGDLMSVVGVLALPLIDSVGRPFAVIELTQGREREPFSAEDELRLQTLTSSLSRMLESWFRMSCTCRKDHCTL